MMNVKIIPVLENFCFCFNNNNCVTIYNVIRVLKLEYNSNSSRPVLLCSIYFSYVCSPQ